MILTKELLECFPLFRAISDQEYAFLQAHVVLTDFDKGSFLIEQGDTSYSLWGIVEGIVRIYHVTKQGEETIIGYGCSGELVGELALYDQKERSMYVQAYTPVRAWHISRTAWLMFLEQSFHTSISVMERLASIVREQNERLILQTHRSLQERIMWLLHDIARSFPEGYIPLSQEEIAALVGATRPRVSEILKKMVHDGFISYSPQGIVLSHLFPREQ